MVNLDRALQLAAELEDEELLRKARHHDEAVDWLDAALNGRSTVGFSWISLLAFLRLSTKIGLFPAPLTVDQAIEHRGEVVTYDSDFGRFPGVTLSPPGTLERSTVGTFLDAAVPHR